MSGFVRTLMAMVERGRGNTWTVFEEMHVYMRVGPARIEGERVQCVQLGNLSLHPRDQRKGTFTRLVEVISSCTDLPIYVEQVINMEFRDALLRRGFKPARSDDNCDDLYLPKETSK